MIVKVQNDAGEWIMVGRYRAVSAEVSSPDSVPRELIIETGDDAGEIRVLRVYSEDANEYVECVYSEVTL